MTITPTTTDRILPKRQVLGRADFSSTTLWREVRAGRFPPPVKLSPNRVGWLESAVNAWIQERRPGSCRGVPKRESEVAYAGTNRGGRATADVNTAARE
jgi:prophage regulatory protein